jgi:hypothetical protein
MQDNRKPEPLIVDRVAGRICAVCGKRSYSASGIHPQCAVKQADEPRQLQLAEERRQARLAERAT